MSQEDIEIIHEVSLKEQLNMDEDEGKEENMEIKIPELQALLMILDEKGIITKDEFTKKLKQLR